jgi:hypothetical protein
VGDLRHLVDAQQLNPVVVFCAKNEAGHISDAIAGVYPAYAAGIVRHMLVVDAATDGTRDEVKKWPGVEYVSEPAALAESGPTLAENGIDYKRAGGKGAAVAMVASRYLSPKDLLVICDVDIQPTAAKIIASLTPLIGDPTIDANFPVSDRYTRSGIDGGLVNQGQRVTRFTARPINTVFDRDVKELFGPLGGTQTIRGSALADMTWDTRYGIETDWIYQLAQRQREDYPTHRLVQNWGGTRTQDGQKPQNLELMSVQVAAAAYERRRSGIDTQGGPNTQLTYPQISLVRKDGIMEIGVRDVIVPRMVLPSPRALRRQFAN